MKITEEWLIEKDARLEAIKYVKEQGLIDLPDVKFVKKLIELKELDYANWLITHVIDKKGCVKYAIFAAEQVLPIWEKAYPADDRPTKAIEAAKKWLINPSADAASAADTADAADTAADAAHAADAADAAYSAANAAYSAASAAYATYAATNAASNADDEYIVMFEKILNFGIELI